MNVQSMIRNESVECGAFLLYQSGYIEYDLKKEKGQYKKREHLAIMISVSLWSVLFSFMTDGNGWRDLAEVAMVIYALSKWLNESKVSKCIFMSEQYSHSYSIMFWTSLTQLHFKQCHQQRTLCHSPEPYPHMASMLEI